MDDADRGATDQDETTAPDETTTPEETATPHVAGAPRTVPLPRRGPRQSRIARAHDDLFGGRDDREDRDGQDRDAGDEGNTRARWVDVEHRERSAALARAVSVGRRDPAVDGQDGTTSEREGTDRVPQPRESTDGEPAVGTAPASPEPMPLPRGPEAPSGRDRRRRRGLVAVVALLIAFGAGTGVGLLLAPTSAPPAAAEPFPSRPTLAGDVVGAADGTTVTVLVDGRGVEVAILGLAPRPANGPVPCGSDAATAFARENLVGQRVTLVPDPVGPEFDGAGRRFAYVVLGSQQNYTDLALLDGIVRWDTSRAFTYGQVFAREEATARTGGRGIWGDPCRAGI